MGNTATLDLRNTMRLSGEVRDDRLILTEDIVFSGRNSQYRILADRPVATGGEAVIYEASDLCTSGTVIAKIYDNWYPDNLISRIARDTVTDFMSSHRDFMKYHLMPLLDYGQVSICSATAGQNFTYYVDIIPVCEGGRVSGADYKTLHDGIIPDICKALRTLHCAGLVHRDVKPENIYLYEGEYVLSDLGLISRIPSKSKFSKTTLHRGTVGYTAPEIGNGYFSPASDYYSLGCTVATLYNGRHVYQEHIDSKDIGSISRLVRMYGMPLSCPPGQESLQTLVNALLLSDDNSRAGGADVELWLRDPLTFGKRFLNLITQQTGQFTYRIGNDEVHTFSEMADTFASQWQLAKDILLAGSDDSNPLISFLNIYDQQKALELIKLRKEASGGADTDLCVAKALHIIYENSPVYWLGRKYDSLSDVASGFSIGLPAHSRLVGLLRSGFLQWKLRRTEKAGSGTISAVAKAEELARDYPEISYHYFRMHFGKDTVKKGYRWMSPDEVFRSISVKKGAEYRKAVASFPGENIIQAYLCYCRYTDAVIKYRKAISKDATSSYELFHILFRAICHDWKAVSNAYLCNCNDAYLLWFKNNLHLFTYLSRSATSLKKQIQDLSFSEIDSIEQLHRNLISLRSLHSSFMGMLQNNIILSYTGFSNTSDCEITSSDLDAYFICSYEGNTVQPGFLRSISIDPIADPALSSEQYSECNRLIDNRISLFKDALADLEMLKIRNRLSPVRSVAFMLLSILAVTLCIILLLHPKWFLSLPVRGIPVVVFLIAADMTTVIGECAVELINLKKIRNASEQLSAVIKRLNRFRNRTSDALGAVREHIREKNHQTSPIKRKLPSRSSVPNVELTEAMWLDTLHRVTFLLSSAANAVIICLVLF
ncbi:MAG: protein kinase, partial [Oscillospiraceae bacterium]|nr:protein kinase [Oscillospiraceae bacterium]